jgi:hypothetical protein
MNDLGWHLEYLETLKDNGNAIAEKAGFYHALVSTYLVKLRQNAHLTITSENPKAGAEIIRFFLSSVSGPSTRRSRRRNHAQIQDDWVEFASHPSLWRRGRDKVRGWWLYEKSF